MYKFLQLAEANAELKLGNWASVEPSSGKLLKSSSISVMPLIDSGETCVINVLLMAWFNDAHLSSCAP